MCLYILGIYHCVKQYAEFLLFQSMPRNQPLKGYSFTYLANIQYTTMIMRILMMCFHNLLYHNQCSLLGWMLIESMLKQGGWPIQNLWQFVYNKIDRCWKPCKKGFTLGRLIWISPTLGELYYLRMMLPVCKGPTCYEDIRTMENIVYPTFRDACFALGFLHNR